MDNGESERLDYDPDKFVDREEALELVLDKARRIADGSPVGRRVTIFHGQRGSGKTWLLEEMQCRLRELFKEHPFQALSADLTPDFDVNNLKSSVPGDRPLILLVDDVNEAEGPVLDELEQDVLAPLAQQGNVLIVLAERGRPFREKADEFDLLPFDRPAIEEQIQKQAPNAAGHLNAVETYGGGFPWSTYILARHLPAKLAALEQCATALLGDEKDVAPYLTALCVLKAFDETRMEQFLPIYPDLPRKRWGYAACRQVREGLVKTTLVRYNADARAYVIDEPLRLVLEACLYERDFELWKKLHCAAYRLYAGWAKDYEQSRDWWTGEKQYHERCLQQAGVNPAQCP
jgi:hypothetical protein